MFLHKLKTDIRCYQMTKRLFLLVICWFQFRSDLQHVGGIWYLLKVDFLL